MAHYDIFRNQLAIKYPAYGHALWEPSPGRLYSAVEVGDVGFIREGKFHRLFNALLPAEHPSHQNLGVPEYHEPLRPTITEHIYSGTLASHDFYSGGVTKTAAELEISASRPTTPGQVSFTCMKKQGAVLSLPVQAQREDTLAKGDFRDHIIRHVDRWFAFAQQLGLGIDQMEDIILGQGDARVSFGVQVSDQNNIQWSFSREHVLGAVLNPGRSGTNLREDQCVFIRGWRVTRTLMVLRRLRGAAEHSPDADGYGSGSEMRAKFVPTVPKNHDPLHVLLEYLAEQVPECDMVAVHDDDLAEFVEGIGGDTSTETLQAGAVMGHLQSVKPEIKQIRHEVVCVAMISKEHKERKPPSSAPLLPSLAMTSQRHQTPIPYHASESPVLAQRTPLGSRDAVPPAGPSKWGQLVHAQDKAPILSNSALNQWLAGLHLGQVIQSEPSSAEVEPCVTYGDRSMVPMPPAYSPPSRGAVMVQQVESKLAPKPLPAFYRTPSSLGSPIPATPMWWSSCGQSTASSHTSPAQRSTNLVPDSPMSWSSWCQSTTSSHTTPTQSSIKYKERGSEENRRHWQQHSVARPLTSPNAELDGLSTQQQANLPSDPRTWMRDPQAQMRISLRSPYAAPSTSIDGAYLSHSLADERTRPGPQVLMNTQAPPPPQVLVPVTANPPVFPTQPTISQGAPLTNSPVTNPSHHYDAGVQPQPPTSPSATRTNPLGASRQERDVETQTIAGGTPFQTQPQAAHAARNAAGPISSRWSSSLPHSHQPLCRLPGCYNSPCFDYSINEQRYYCETHIHTVVHVGFAAPCRWCQQMPAHDNSEFCSRSCSNACGRLQQIIYQQSTMDAALPHYALRGVTLVAGETGEEALQWYMD